MVNPHQVQHRGVEIVQVNTTLDRLVAMIIGLTVNKTPFHTPASE